MKRYQISRDKFMSSEEVRQLLKVCEDQTIIDQVKGRKTWVTRYMLVHLALHSGLRVSELAALTISDLHLAGRETYLVVRSGKGGKRRDVYLDREIVRHLKEYIAHKARAWQEPVDVEAPLFMGRSGHFTETALHLSFRKAVETAGLSRRYSIHAARHTYATILLAKTNNLRFVQKQLGHASLNMTALYADVLPEQNQDLANAMIE
ncbi:Phage integrase family protein [Desulfatibacillum alkenivorans DSM 16219]|jgi:site-specific recombinase XerD|uniref:Phage integrase family protein n=1 Tax=Desulfatibacillum alkenivorans DSM 16219 TaxID=1121393 RepID=A0A1M6N461_9BACT|nr:tyrosine-type recombinase/integrase [Desulfatibacillum alkenivorans]SHJ90467.1 Phage integrase family protein [Desulfatibacillum alkenivorans DSM 16219]